MGEAVRQARHGPGGVGPAELGGAVTSGAIETYAQAMDRASRTAKYDTEVRQRAARREELTNLVSTAPTTESRASRQAKLDDFLMSSPPKYTSTPVKRPREEDADED